MANQRKDFAYWWKRIDRIISVKRNQVIILATMSTGMLCVLVVFGVILFRAAGEMDGGAVAKAPGNAPQIILPTPTPPCTERTLILTNTSLRAVLVKPAADGTYAVPQGDSAYWYEGSTPGYVFSLSQSDLNKAMVSSLQAGDLVTVSGVNCSEESFTLEAPEAEASFTPKYAEQPGEGFVLFLRTMQQGQGVIVRGKMLEPETIPTETPAPEGAANIDAEISLLGTTTSGDKSSIQVQVSVKNVGATAFQVRFDDVHIAVSGSESISLTKSKPSLPKVIQPGETDKFYLTFDRPSSMIAVLRIFDTEFDLQGY